MEHPFTRKWLDLDFSSPLDDINQVANLPGENNVYVKDFKELYEKFEKHGQNISVLSYNILAQSLVNLRERYKYCPKLAAKWKFRRNNLLKEIKEANADIICLQECDFYQEFWKDELFKCGYQTMHKCHLRPPEKKSDNKFDKNQSEKGNANPYMPYGILLGFKISKFDLVKYKATEYHETMSDQDFEMHNKQNHEPHYLPSQLMEYYQTLMQTNVLQLMALKLKNEYGANFGVVVTNTHSYFRASHTYTRLRQNLSMIEECVKFSSEIQNKEKTKMWPIISCGDFNITPDAINYSILTSNRSHDELEKSKQYHELSVIPSHLLTDYHQEMIDGFEKFLHKDMISSFSEECSSISGILKSMNGTTTSEEKNEKIKLFKEKVENLLTLQRRKHVRGILQYMKEHIPHLISTYRTHSILNKVDESKINDKLWWGEPPFTNYVDKFKATLDFIFLYINNDDNGNVFDICGTEIEPKQNANPLPTKRIPPKYQVSNQYMEGILPIKILQVPNLEKLVETDGIPNASASSDHIPIMCEMRIMPII